MSECQVEGMEINSSNGKGGFIIKESWVFLQSLSKTVKEAMVLKRFYVICLSNPCLST